MPEGLPRQVAAFLARNIVSVEQLEVLLLLRRTSPRAWTPAEVSDELRSSPASAGLRLRDLRERGLVVLEGERFHHERGSDDPVIGQLEKAYAERRYTVIDLIFAKPIEPLRVFADAFRFKKEDDDG